MKRKQNEKYKCGIGTRIYYLIIGMLFMFLIIVSYNYLSVKTPYILDGLISHGGETVEVETSLSEGCEDLNIFDSAKCMNRNLRKFFKYNESNTGKDLTFDELKEQGGVCSHYSSLYYDAARKLNFYAEEVYIMYDDDVGHVFTVISNQDGYCLLDEEIVQCYKFEG